METWRTVSKTTISVIMTHKVRQCKAVRRNRAGGTRRATPPAYMESGCGLRRGAPCLQGDALRPDRFDRAWTLARSRGGQAEAFTSRWPAAIRDCRRGAGPAPGPVSGAGSPDKRPCAIGSSARFSRPGYAGRCGSGPLRAPDFGRQLSPGRQLPHGRGGCLAWAPGR